MLFNCLTKRNRQKTIASGTLKPTSFLYWMENYSDQSKGSVPQNAQIRLGGGFKRFFFTPTWGNDPI